MQFLEVGQLQKDLYNVETDPVVGTGSISKFACSTQTNCTTVVIIPFKAMVTTTPGIIKRHLFRPAVDEPVGGNILLRGERYTNEVKT